MTGRFIFARASAQNKCVKCVNNAAHSEASSACLQSHHSWIIRFFPFFFHPLNDSSFVVYFGVVMYYLCDDMKTFTKINVDFNTYPNQWLHFVQLCWRSINQLTLIERHALTIWVWCAGVFQQISLSSWWEFVVAEALSRKRTFKNKRHQCQLIHRRYEWNLLSLFICR